MTLADYEKLGEEMGRDLSDAAFVKASTTWRKLSREESLEAQHIFYKAAAKARTDYQEAVKIAAAKKAAEKAAAEAAAAEAAVVAKAKTETSKPAA